MTDKITTKRFVNLDRHLSQRYEEIKVLDPETGESVTTRVRVGPEIESKTHRELSDEEFAEREKTLDEDGRIRDKPIDHQLDEQPVDLPDPKPVLVDDHLEG
jgi:hypothetical protein